VVFVRVHEIAVDLPKHVSTVAKVSIIIPTYNRAAMLPQAIESAKNAGGDPEVIVVDNGSTDETPEVCRTISGIRYIRLYPNVKQSRARNAGIEASTCEFLLFLDDDDIRLPGTLEAQVNLLESDPSLGFVYGPVLIGDPKNCIPTGRTSLARCLEGDLFWSLLERPFIRLHSMVARKKLIEEVGLFDPELVGAEDWMLMIRLAERGLVRAVEEPVAVYRMFERHSGQTSSNRLSMCRVSAIGQAQALTLPRALKAPMAKRKQVRQDCLDLLSMELITESRADWSNGLIRSALRHFAAALQINPRRALTLRAFKWLLLSPWESEKRRSRVAALMGWFRIW
jgi:cellulose synthase/poly-beta-1,6-N-acetylglucosamine synthase-like glycosyltransferase